ncbi:hypothetical protein [Microbacterium amylolyticum]|uniref:Transposase n=1 Tax=Microbacterium amylolyticum TaxID=936337 RepID=A0ABS4ZHZ5_9MICO|nr:hypothetical protein [Microbacterium amylolyticum]MBP2436896.1 hypothetical protein [Microbacterium amylolyticum]
MFDDHVQRQFRADAPNRLWLTDITEHWTNEGELYCCAIKDGRPDDLEARRRRRQDRLGRLTPVEFETIMNTTVALAA